MEEHAVAAAVGVKRQTPISENGTSKYRKTHGLHEEVGRSLKPWTTRFEIHRKVTGSTACWAQKTYTIKYCCITVVLDTTAIMGRSFLRDVETVPLVVSPL